jgi:hypothetical protein
MSACSGFNSACVLLKIIIRCSFFSRVACIDALLFGNWAALGSGPTATVVRFGLVDPIRLAAAKERHKMSRRCRNNVHLYELRMKLRRASNRAPFAVDPNPIWIVRDLHPGRQSTDIFWE